MATIAVSIASYKDPEVVSTIDELFLKASGENYIVPFVLTQEDEGDHPDLLKVSNHYAVAASASEGACWARRTVQDHILRNFFENPNTTDYYFQLDSHHVLAKNWDKLLIEDHTKALDYSGKAIITAYLPGYEFAGSDRIVPVPEPTNFTIHNDHGIPAAVAHYIKPTDMPPVTHFYSGHFAFTTLNFIREVPYDPELFFFGEEITLAIRAYTAGYTLCAPSQYVGAHLYQRIRQEGGERKLFWDVSEDKGRKLAWWQRDIMSKIKSLAICKGEWFGRYGIQDFDLYREFSSRMKKYHGVDLNDCHIKR